MQLYLGGTCAGKRALVQMRFDEAVWCSAQRHGEQEWDRVALPEASCLVVEGWERRLQAELAVESDDDRIRAWMKGELEALGRLEDRHGLEIVLIMLEMGRGIVPMDPAQRRLRDLNGWLAQDAATLCDEVLYVRHGLARALKR